MSLAHVALVFSLSVTVFLKTNYATIFPVTQFYYQNLVLSFLQYLLKTKFLVF